MQITETKTVQSTVTWKSHPSRLCMSKCLSREHDTKILGRANRLENRSRANRLENFECYLTNSPSSTTDATKNGEFTPHARCCPHPSIGKMAASLYLEIRTLANKTCPHKRRRACAATVSNKYICEVWIVDDSAPFTTMGFSRQ